MELDLVKTNQINTNNYPIRTRNVKKRIPLISIIIPLFNEENSIKDVIERIPNLQNYEIIVVDDGSTDNSIIKVQEIKNKQIKVISHRKNKGYGEALLSGFKHAKGDIFVTLDSDGQHNPEDLSYLIKPILKNQADIVIGSRYLGVYNYKRQKYAQLGAYLVKICLKFIFFQKVRDNQSGFRAFSSDTNNIFRNMHFTDMGFSTEILFKSAFYKYKIIEVPISSNPRKFGRSYVNLIRIIKSITLCIIFYLFRRFKLKINHQFINKLFNIILSK